MSCYISSNANRLYAGFESTYGQVPTVDAANRFPAVKLTTRQQTDAAERRDKTGSRTFAGIPAGTRRRTTFDLKTYMTGWDHASAQSGYGPLFHASLGGTPIVYDGGIVGAGSTQSTMVFSGDHGLAPGQAITHGGEIRFVQALVSTTTVQLNAPLSVVPVAGAPLGPTVSYFPATELGSMSVFDYWSPSTAIQRILCGAAVDKMQININGDFHEFEFSGIAQDLIDSVSFSSGLGQLTSFPDEPAAALFDYAIIPGHLGQAWLGNTPDRFYTITNANVLVDNNLDLRAREFGSALARCISPGRRSVSVDFDLYGDDEATSIGLYQAARQQSPIEMMFQLGQQSGQLFGVHLQSIVPEVPEFDDGESRLQWKFKGSRAQGTVDDEIVVAFG
ncbi:MAG: phage tail tube protein [Bryobacteraceae bacterium]